MNTSLSRLQSFYNELKAPLLLHAIIRREFPGCVALLTSFSKDAGALLCLVAAIHPSIPVLFLDTGRHPPEMLAYARTLAARLGLTGVRFLTPDPELLARSGQEHCCQVRKSEPLARALEAMGLLALITDRRRDEHAGLEKIELDENGVFRINPLADWTAEKLQSEIEKYDLPAPPATPHGCASCSFTGLEERKSPQPAPFANWSV